MAKDQSLELLLSNSYTQAEEGSAMPIQEICNKVFQHFLQIHRLILQQHYKLLQDSNQLQ